ncbi:hypothetical protein P5F91_20535 [Nitrospirillum amazonense]|nr:hypothetical protein [Nitrospirillum amazonense]MDG3442878.1 hypothetical protein [Nitrospirillum amazonense]
MIVAKAKVAGLSMSAYVRRCALDDDAGDSEKAALAQVDAIIIGMESALDSATSALDAVLERLDATQ